MTKEAKQCVEILKKQLPHWTPKMAIVLGSGLGGLANEIKNPVKIPYDLLPGFHKPVVEGHLGQLVLGELEGLDVICLQGRAHLYEGINPKVIQTMVRTCRLMGCETWLATNATGGMREELVPGTLVIVKDHINFQFINPLTGMNDDEFGPRFIGMDDAYDPILRRKLHMAADQLDIPIHEGVYFAAAGPSFETPAEIKAFRMLGGDVVGMSTVPEIIVARHCGMKTVAISVVTNLAAGLYQGVLTHDETLRGAALGADNLLKLVRQFIKDY